MIRAYWSLNPGDVIRIKWRGRFSRRARVTGKTRDGKSIKAQVENRAGYGWSDSSVPISPEQYIELMHAAECD